jgi:hypothetical protein
MNRSESEHIATLERRITRLEEVLTRLLERTGAVRRHEGLNVEAQYDIATLEKDPFDAVLTGDPQHDNEWRHKYGLE